MENENYNNNNQNTTGADNNSEPNNNQNEKTTFSKEEVDALLQKEADRRVTEALKTARARWDRESSTKIREAEKLGKMDEDQRNAYNLEQALKEIEQMKLDKAKAENTQETLKVLSNRSLPASLLDFVLTSDADTTLEKINSIQAIITSLVNAEVDKRLPKQGAPKASTIGTDKMTRDVFNKLSLTKQAEMLKANPKLLDELK